MQKQTSEQKVSRLKQKVGEIVVHVRGIKALTGATCKTIIRLHASWWPKLKGKLGKDSFSSVRCYNPWGPEGRAQDSHSHNEWDAPRDRALK